MTTVSPFRDPSPAPRGNHEDPIYRNLLERFSARFDELVASSGALFTTDVGHLWETYIATFPMQDRQFHTCNACRSFIRRHGGLAVIFNGRVRSAFWSDDVEAPDTQESAAFREMRFRVERSRVTGVFLSSERTLGYPLTGVWRHLSVKLPDALVYKGVALDAGQSMAEKRQDFKTVSRALAEYSVPLLVQAVALLKTDALYRTEKVLGQAEWLLNLAGATSQAKGPGRDNMIWSGISKAPAGFCHPRSSMIGTLLDDLAAGLPLDDVAAKFKAKMHPLQYQRPKAAPAAGTIAQAEKLVEKLGIARSLERRFARLDEVQKLWAPKEAKPSTSGGVFGHLTPKGRATTAPLAVSGATSITWEKFARTVLPTAETIDVHVPVRGNFVGMATAVHADAPPILQWDREEQRNPFSWYVYHNGSDAWAWGLKSGWTRCPAVVLQPSMWHGATSNHAKNAILVIEGQRDRGTPGAGLFPETLKAELHGVRSVIEAHSRSAQMHGAEEGSANGLSVIGAHVRVTCGSVVAEYRIDRWD